ncbi:aldo/keto reductase [Gulosibacter chungangensis]|uniref:Aldo/keto reductase n=1 Tax=Gulosibacter chungangensis TaxID=979746 RepID=A0A7J5BA05_9MICO|nr:aldo/keto reductase [Gulosibacter chungangensis]KAB1642589.1 aldo/keto reductase [Gulosibacter chungangensis]
MTTSAEFASQPIGFGTWPFKDEEAVRSVASAIEIGYRLIDTASKYENEQAVGRGIAASGLPREELFVQTKLRGHDHGDVRGALERSLEWLGVDYLDSWLIHWPLPMLGLYSKAFEQMAHAREEGLVRSIGVSNFLPEHLDALKAETGLVPAVDQLPCDPSLNRPELRAELAARGIQVQSWSPLARGGEVLEAQPVLEVAQARGITPGQVVLAWHHSNDLVPIVRSGSAQRQRENLEAVSIELTDAEVASISSLPQRGLGDFDPRTRDER